MKNMKSLCEISADTLSKTRNVIVAGDIHGDYASFQRILKQFNSRQDLIVFLGDYADRGPKGIEVIEGIRASHGSSLTGFSKAQSRPALIAKLSPSRN